MSLLHYLAFKLDLVAKFQISRIYKKNQDDLTIRDLAYYYMYKSTLQMNKADKEEFNLNYLKKIKADNEQLLWLFKRGNLYGPNTKIYDFPRH